MSFKFLAYLLVISYADAGTKMTTAALTTAMKCTYCAIRRISTSPRQAEFITKICQSRIENRISTAFRRKTSTFLLSKLFSSKNEQQQEQPYASDYHAPVMADECIEALLSAPSVSDKYRRNLEQRPIFIDATLGGGGHSEALLERLRELGADRDGSPDSDRRPLGMVVGIDRDPDAIAAATRRLRSYVEDGSFMAIQTNFADLEIALEQHGIPPVADGMLLDLGVSSHQIDDPERGFSFSKEGPLDMRMTRHHDDPERLAPLLSTPSTSAADIVNLSDMSRIRTILATYGEEPRAKKIADAIVARRPLRTTSDLVEAVASVVPERARSRRMGRTATLARVFQALRVAVNGEDRELRRVLTEAAPDIVVEGGRLVVLGYHSLEDRVVKQVMKRGYFGKADVRIEDQKDVYGNYNGPPLPWKMLGKGSRAKEEEVELNPRARSAILRVGERQAGD